MNPLISIVMGSSSDWDTLRHAAEILDGFQVPHEKRVVSAHRMPDDMFAFADQAAARGLRAIIAGAGGAAHLPGMLAAKTVVPVLGVPVASKHLNGVDSLYSIVQMPKGIPVATFAIGAGRCRQCGAVRSGHAGRPRRRPAPATARVPGAPDRRRARHDAGPAVSAATPPAAGAGRYRCRRAHRCCPTARCSACSAAASSGACSCTPRSRTATASRCSSPTPPAPPGAAADLHLCAPYTDATALAQLRQTCAAVTTEFENVPADALRAAGGVAAGGAARQPRSRSASTARWRSAASCRPVCPARRTPWSNPRPTPPRRRWRRCCPASSRRRGWATTARARPSSTRADDLPAAWAALGGVPCVLEQRLPLRHEISVIVARGRDGAGGAPAGAAEPAPCRHPGGDAGAGARHRRVHRGAAPSRWPSRLAQALRLRRRAVRRVLRAAGRLAGGQRDGAAAAQLGPLQHRRLRRLAVRPAGAHAGRPAAGAAAPALGGGDAQPAGRPLVRPRGPQPRTPDWAGVLALPGVHLHLYGKAEARRGRKMGHLTVTAADATARACHGPAGGGAARPARLLKPAAAMPVLPGHDPEAVQAAAAAAGRRRAGGLSHRDGLRPGRACRRRRRGGAHLRRQGSPGRPPADRARRRRRRRRMSSPPASVPRRSA